MVKVTLEFEGVDQAIFALGKLSSIATVAPKGARKGRTDKGQPREPYGPRTTVNATTPAKAGTPAAADQTEATVSVPAAPAVVAPKAAAASEPASAGSEGSVKVTEAKPAGAPAQAAAAAPGSTADAQAALEALFTAKGRDVAVGLLQRNGVERLRDLKSEQLAGFTDLAKKIVALNGKPGTPGFEQALTNLYAAS